MSAAVIVSFSLPAAAVQIAGNLLINLRAEDYDPATLEWTQASATGIPGSFLTAQNPQRYPVAGATAVVMDGTGEFFVGPNTTEELHGDNVSHSVEMWVFQGNARAEEAVISWGQRGGPDGTVASFRYGTDSRWGAIARWGQPDMGFEPVADAAANRSVPPPLGTWNLLTFVYNSTTLTQSIYVNGVLNATEIVTNPGSGLNAHDNQPINIGSDREGNGTITGGDVIPYSGAINRIRVHSGVLSAADVLANYNEEAPQFATGLTAAQVTRAPVHRYSFNNPAGDALSMTVVPDTIGGFDAMVMGEGATFSGSELVLPGGSPTTQAYVDLPNGVLSNKQAATIEVWVTQTGNQNWSRIIDIGSNTAGEVGGPGGAFNGTNFLALTGNTGGSTNQRFERAGGGVTHGPAYRDAHNSTMLNQQFHHLVTYDDVLNEWRWFRNGILMEVIPDVQGPATLADVNVWLGRSNFAGDANFQGRFNEVRIYDYTLTESQAYGNFVAGPDNLNFDGTLPAIFTWQPEAEGTFNWNLAGNWTGPGGFPNSATASVRLVNNGMGQQTINLNAPISVNSLIFGTSELGTGGATTLAAGTGGTLTFNAPAGGTANLYMPNWSFDNTISAPINLAVDTFVSNTRPANTDSLMLTGTLSGPGALIKGGTGDVEISGNSPGYTADLQVNAGRLIISGIVGSSEYMVRAGSVLEIDRTGAVTFSGMITGPGVVEFTGPAAVTFTGEATTTGDFTILDGTFTQQGSLQVGSLRTDVPTVLAADSFTSVVNYASVGVDTGGSLTIRDGAQLTMTTGGGDFNVGDVGMGQSVLYMQGGLLGFKTIFVGKNPGTNGVVIQTGGDISKLPGGGESRIGGAFPGSQDVWGAWLISGGTFVMDNNLQIGAYGRGVMEVNGGAVAVNGWIAVGRFQSGLDESYGLLDVRAGSFSQQGGGTRLLVGEEGNGVLNVRGTGTVNLEGGLIVGAGSAEAPGNGVVNLHTGGTLTTPLIAQFNNAAASGVFNFHGGQLVATAANEAFMQGLDSAFVHSGGARIDTNGFDITIAQPLRAPNGGGVTSIPVTSGGSGYLAPPLLEIINGGGSGATAVAQVSGGAITGIVVTNPGVGYTSAPTVVVRGGGDGTGFTAGTPVTGANVSGGLTKTGGGLLTLSGASNYRGPTLVQAGGLRITGDLTAATGAVTVSSGASLGGTGIIGGAVTVNGGTLAPGITLGTLTASQNVTLSGGSTFAVDLNDSLFPTSDRLVVQGSLNLSGVNLVASATGAATGEAYIIATWGGNLTGTFSSVSLPPGYTVNYAYNNGVHSRNIAIVSGEPGGSAFDSWIGGFFPGVTNPAIIGIGADPDGDGATNLQEFALGGAPNDPTNNGLYFVFTTDSSDPGVQPELLLTLAVRANTPVFAGTTTQTASVDGVTYIVEGSENLVNFNSAVSRAAPVTNGLPTPPAGYEYRTFRLDASDGLPTRGFLRARITAP